MSLEDICNRSVRFYSEPESESIRYFESLIKDLEDLQGISIKFKKDMIKDYAIDDLKKEIARREQNALDNELEALREWAEDSLLPVMNNAGIKEMSMHVFDGQVMIVKSGDGK